MAHPTLKELQAEHERDAQKMLRGRKRFTTTDTLLHYMSGAILMAVILFAVVRPTIFNIGLVVIVLIADAYFFWNDRRLNADMLESQLGLAKLWGEIELMTRIEEMSDDKKSKSN